jgi:hypothetical protein
LSFVLTLPLKTEKYQEDILNKRFEISRNIYNSILGVALKRYRRMIYSPEYKQIIQRLKQYRTDKEKKPIYKLMNNLRTEYKLNEYSLDADVKLMQHHFKQNIDAFTAQKIVTRVWVAFEKLIFSDGKKVHFKKYGQINSIEGKSNDTGIRFKDNQLLWNGLEIPVIIKTDYDKEALTNKICYCRIMRKFIKGKYKYYVQLILQGTPPRKIDYETGEIKHTTGYGKIGIDIGTQTIAISSNTDVKLLELADRVNNIEKEKRRIQRYMDRSRRANNPDNFNDDGTIKKQGNKKVKWIKSKKYIKMQSKLRELYRKQTDVRRQCHNIMCNWLITLGNEFYVEDMNFKGLQKRAKETTINEKTGKYNKKKRFGKSLANKAPSMFLTILDNKLKYQNNQLIKVNTKELKASQFNHLNCKYNKKKLSQRWNNLNGVRVQRDLYSAFLIQHVNNDLKTVNIELCNKNFNKFLDLHNKEIKRLNSCELKSALKNVI